MIVSTDWLAERLDKDVVIVEVGAKSDYVAGHIPGARFLDTADILTTVNLVPNELRPVAELEEVFSALGIGNQARVVLYSRSPLLASRAWFTLDYLGQGHRVSLLDGGFAKWSAEAKPVVTAVPQFAAVAFTATPNSACVTDSRGVKQLVRSRDKLGSSLLILDARPAVFYRGMSAGNGVSRAGHIPGAINLPWVSNLTSDRDNATFKSDDELIAMYSKLGVTRDTTVVAYCRTGVEASMNYFVLRYLGFDPILYDESFIVWSRDPETIVL
jgi:thiosulfate/3-mercaptopyruvate sulfurtransferase